MYATAYDAAASKRDANVLADIVQMVARLCIGTDKHTFFYWSMACCQKWKVTHDTKIPVHITLTVLWHGDSMQNLATPITLARCVVLYRPTRRS